jgi:hypothetical protein
MMEAICSSETPVLTGAIGRNIPEDDILKSPQNKQTNSVAFSPQANYTDWALNLHTCFKLNFKRR